MAPARDQVIVIQRSLLYKIEDFGEKAQPERQHTLFQQNRIREHLPLRKPGGLSQVDKGALGLAGCFLIAGMIGVLFPVNMVVIHPTNDHQGSPMPSWREGVNKNGCRTYGIIAIVIGMGISAAVLYKAKS